MRKKESAPYREFAEYVYGGKREDDTVQESSEGSVRCGKRKVHRIGNLRRMCTVGKEKMTPYRKVAKEVCGAEKVKCTV